MATKNVASITTTNGESCGHIIPGTGVILNNMLGEQDLNPLGFHNWIDKKRTEQKMIEENTLGIGELDKIDEKKED